MNRIDNFNELKLNNVLVFNDFLSARICNELLFKINHQFWEESTVGRLTESLKYKQYYSLNRTNTIYHHYHFGVTLNKIISKIENKILEELDTDAGRLEYWQISKYAFKQKFDYHNDCGCWSNDPSGEREKTILLYLTTPDLGGETHFRALNLYIKPIQGRLVIWNNLLPNGNCNYSMIHASLPIKRGIKITLNSWLRQSNYKPKSK
jgi:prolyl 4-hydroxylase